MKIEAGVWRHQTGMNLNISSPTSCTLKAMMLRYKAKSCSSRKSIAPGRDGRAGSESVVL